MEGEQNPAENQATTLPSNRASARWGNYFKEFLMLFLAVFCGYLVEEYREKQQDGHLARTYLKSLAEDVLRDSLEINRLEEICQMAIRENDTILSEIRSGRIRTDSRLAYLQLENSANWEDFSPNDGTLQQLKHIGALRTIESKEVVDKLMAYQATHVQLKVHENIGNAGLDDYFGQMSIFNSVVLYDSSQSKLIPLLAQDQKSLCNLFHHILSYRAKERSLIFEFAKIKKAGANLRLAIRTYTDEE